MLHTLENLLLLRREPSQTKYGLDESPTVMVVETKSRKLGKKRGIQKTNWAFVETNKLLTYLGLSKQLVKRGNVSN